MSTFNPATLSDQTSSGLKIIGQTEGETLAFGQACYQKASDGAWYKAKADSGDTMPCDGIRTETAGVFLQWGYIRNDSWTDWPTTEEGEDRLIYVSAATAGQVGKTAPTTVGHKEQVIGRAYKSSTAKILKVNLENLMVEV